VPIYYFDVEGDATRSEGHELANLAAAKCEAATLAGQEMCDKALTFWDNQEWSLTVSNEAGLSLFTITVMGTEAPAIQYDRRVGT
jgi:hypothetical protein